MNAVIHLTKMVGADNVPPGTRQSWPLTIMATGDNMPAEIFVYQNGNPMGGGDQFSCVASVPQMEEIPKYNGYSLGANLAVPFYRISQMNLICRTPEEVERIWCIIQQEVAALVESWNAANVLIGVARVAIEEDNIITESLGMNPPQLIQLRYQPAGTATYVDSIQGITSPDTTLPGWLPVSAAPPSWTVPAGAIFFYNIDEDTNLKALWPLPTPLSGNQLFRNGILLPYGVTHVFDQNTIWWLAFTPGNIPGYVRSDDGAPDWSAPWPVDFINLDHPGAVAPNLSFLVFEDQ